LKIDLDKRLKSEQQLAEKLKEKEEQFNAHKETSKKELDRLDERIIALENEKNELKSEITAEKEKVDSLQGTLSKKEEECKQITIGENVMKNKPISL
jgi:chromosome segregation ATPase